ncbi:MAG: acyl-CoA thioesterase [Limisphaerales bacterium]
MSEPEVFRHRHRVTYAECTVGNHIYHSRYLDLLEAARGEFLRHAGFPLLPLQESGVIFPVIEARVRYLRPARYDDVLIVELQLIQLEGVRLGVLHRVKLEDGTPVLEAETRHVCTRLDDKPRRIPAELMTGLRRWLVPELEGRVGGVEP